MRLLDTWTCFTEVKHFGYSSPSLRLANGSKWFEVRRGNCWRFLLICWGFLHRFDEQCDHLLYDDRLSDSSPLWSSFTLFKVGCAILLISSCNILIISLQEISSNFKLLNSAFIISQHSHTFFFSLNIRLKTGAKIVSLTMLSAMMQIAKCKDVAAVHRHNSCSW